MEWQPQQEVGEIVAGETPVEEVISEVIRARKALVIGQVQRANIESHFKDVAPTHPGKVVGPLILVFIQQFFARTGNIGSPRRTAELEIRNSGAWRKRTELLQAQRGDHRRSVGELRITMICGLEVVAEPKFVYQGGQYGVGVGDDDGLRVESGFLVDPKLLRNGVAEVFRAPAHEHGLLPG